MNDPARNVLSKICNNKIQISNNAKKLQIILSIDKTLVIH